MRKFPKTLEAKKIWMKIIKWIPIEATDITHRITVDLRPTASIEMETLLLWRHYPSIASHELWDLVQMPCEHSVSFFIFILPEWSNQKNISSWPWMAWHREPRWTSKEIVDFGETYVWLHFGWNFSEIYRSEHEKIDSRNNSQLGQRSARIGKTSKAKRGRTSLGQAFRFELYIAWNRVHGAAPRATEILRGDETFNRSSLAAT